MTDKIETLQDNFDDNSIDTNKWSVFNYLNLGIVQEANQQIEIITPDGLVNNHQLYSKNSYSFSGSSAFVKIINVGDQINSGATLALNMFLALTYSIIFDVYHNQLRGRYFDFVTVNFVNVKVETYNSNIHKYLRIRELNGTVYWDYSIDGWSWTNFTSLVFSPALSSNGATLILQASNLDAPYTSQTLIFDNFNVGSVGDIYSRILDVKEDDRTIEAEDETRTISTEEDRDLVT